MGAQLAIQALVRGHRVTVVKGPTTEPFPAGARVIEVETAAQMERAMVREAPRADLLIMAAAVADFRPAKTARHKQARGGQLVLRLESTPEIVGRLPRRAGQRIIGFAVESEQVVARAMRKFRRKHLDLLLAQQADGQGAPFGRNRVQAWLVEGTGAVTALGRVSKPRVARALLDKAETLWYGRQHD